MSQFDDMDPKQKALAALTLAAEVFFRVTLIELDRRFPGRAQQNRDLVDRGEGHVAISIQTNGTELRAALALVTPEFVDVLEPCEMRLQGPVTAAFGDPDKVSIVNLAKLN
ncbi:MAG: hypothetical protein IT515_16065 [Burkholderiales bacterium]|nr:hypothetical protein [Burkholderiales bacterium]